MQRLSVGGTDHQLEEQSLMSHALFLARRSVAALALMALLLAVALLAATAPGHHVLGGQSWNKHGSSTAGQSWNKNGGHVLAGQSWNKNGGSGQSWN